MRERTGLPAVRYRWQPQPTKGVNAMRYAIVNSLQVLPPERTTVYWSGGYWSGDATDAALFHEGIARNLADKLERLPSMTEPNGLIDEVCLAVGEARQLEELEELEESVS